MVGTGGQGETGKTTGKPHVSPTHVQKAVVKGQAKGKHAGKQVLSANYTGRRR